MKKIKEHYEARRCEVYAKNRESLKIMWDDKEEIRKHIYSELINENSAIVEVGVRLAENACLMYTYNPKEMFLVDPWISIAGYPHHSSNKKFYERVKNVFEGYNNVKIKKKGQKKQ